MNLHRTVLIMALGLSTWILSPAIALAQATIKVQTPPKMQEKGKAAKELIDLNSAKAEELETLPGVGPATSRKIIDSRPHHTFADLAKAGINESTIEKLRPLATVKPLPAAIDVNLDSLEQLQTLPGIGPVIAKEMAAARPFKGYDDLAKIKGIGPEKLDALKGRVKFGEKAKVAPLTAASRVPAGKKININKASKDELQLLRGIGEARSQEIINGRPYKTIEDLKKLKGIKDVEFDAIKDEITVK